MNYFKKAIIVAFDYTKTQFRDRDDFHGFRF